jgi:hypothetical protein
MLQKDTDLPENKTCGNSNGVSVSIAIASSGQKLNGAVSVFDIN